MTAEIRRFPPPRVPSPPDADGDAVLRKLREFTPAERQFLDAVLEVLAAHGAEYLVELCERVQDTYRTTVTTGGE